MCFKQIRVFLTTKEPYGFRDLAHKKLKVFNRNHNFIEFCLTHNNKFSHHCKKLISNHGETLCALCYHHQTQYGCTVCKVALCRIPSFKILSIEVKFHRDSGYNIWHSCKDIEEQRRGFSSNYNKGPKKCKTRRDDSGQIKSPLLTTKKGRNQKYWVQFDENSTDSLHHSSSNECKQSVGDDKKYTQTWW